MYDIFYTFTALMKLLLLFFVISSAFLQSCLNNYSTQVSSSNKVVKPSSQEIAEDSVIQYIKRSFIKDGKYENVNFGELIANKPKEILVLDSLYAVKRKLPFEKNEYGKLLPDVIASNDSAIAFQKKKIHQAKIYHTFEINHLFKVIKNDSDITLYETKFILFPNYQIKDLNTSLKLQLTNKEDELFDYFIRRYPLYQLEDYNKSRELNRETYDNLFETLENEKEDKETLLITILNITKYIRQNNNFDQISYIKHAAEKWVENKLNLQDYQSVKFSPVEEIKNEQDATIGFKTFHLYKCVIDDVPVEKTLYFEFNANLVLVGAMEIDPPFEKYFKE